MLRPSDERVTALSRISAPHSQHTAGSQEVEIGYLAALLFEDHDA